MRIHKESTYVRFKKCLSKPINEKKNQTKALCIPYNVYEAWFIVAQTIYNSQFTYSINEKHRNVFEKEWKKKF